MALAPRTTRATKGMIFLEKTSKAFPCAEGEVLLSVQFQAEGRCVEEFSCAPVGRARSARARSCVPRAHSEYSSCRVRQRPPGCRAVGVHVACGGKGRSGMGFSCGPVAPCRRS
jgi:hypothetical protein